MFTIPDVTSKRSSLFLIYSVTNFCHLSTNYEPIFDNSVDSFRYDLVKIYGPVGETEKSNGRIPFNQSRF